MKVGVIVPTRGDRPELLNNTLRLIRTQSGDADLIQVVDYKPESDKIDLTQRVRRAYQAMDCDLVFIMEDDDWYSQGYMFGMIGLYLHNKKPDIMGFDSSMYYSLKSQKYRIMKHPDRSSLMSTVIKGCLDFEWPSDDTVFLDLHLWKVLKGVTIGYRLPPHAIGIKHGIGMCAGSGHKDSFKYDTTDEGLFALQRWVDPKSFELYKKIHAEK